MPKLGLVIFLEDLVMEASTLGSITNMIATISDDKCDKMSTTPSLPLRMREPKYQKYAEDKWDKLSTTDPTLLSCMG